VPARRRIVALLAVLAVGIAPSAALAQSGGAGDDQYVDPLGGGSQQQQQQDSSSNSSGGSSNGPSLSSTPSLNAQASPSTTASPTATAAQTLPRTGVDARAVAAIGLALVLAGVALRRRLADERL
jgi:LPXTG-motif cell wall-anchored protein